MGVGKYSLTVSASYARDQSWFERNGGGYGNGNNPLSDFDNDGFDSYGYSGDYVTGVDRAGYSEDDYAQFEVDEHSGELAYPCYDRVEREWRGRLLGDLNDYFNLWEVARLAGLDEKDFLSYSPSLTQHNKWIGTYQSYYHRSDINDILARYAAFKGRK